MHLDLLRSGSWRKNECRGSAPLPAPMWTQLLYKAIAYMYVFCPYGASTEDAEHNWSRSVLLPPSFTCYFPLFGSGEKHDQQQNIPRRVQDEQFEI